MSWQHLGLSDLHKLCRSMCKADPADQTLRISRQTPGFEIRCCCCVSLGPHLVLSLWPPIPFFKLQEQLPRAPKLTQTVRKLKDVTRHLQIAAVSSRQSLQYQHHVDLHHSLQHHVLVLTCGTGGLLWLPKLQQTHIKTHPDQ